MSLSPRLSSVATPPTPRSPSTLDDVTTALALISKQLSDFLWMNAPGATQWVATKARTTQLFVKIGPGILFSIDGSNNNAATRYIQLFDQRDTTAPPENAVPDFSYFAAATAGFSKDFGPRGQEFKNGLFIVCSSTEPTKTIATANDMFCAVRFL